MFQTANPKPCDFHARFARQAGKGGCQGGDKAFLFRGQDGLLISARALASARDSLKNVTPAGLADDIFRLLGESAATQGGTPLFVGAFPFEGLKGARVYVASDVRFEQVETDDALSGVGEICGDMVCTVPAEVARTSHPDESGFKNAVRRALWDIRNGAYKKVVLARRLDLSFQQPLNAAALFGRLSARHPRAFVFSVPGGCGKCAFLGASPELLLRRRGDQIASNPLAGSMICTPDYAENVRRAKALMDCPKNTREHKFVSERVGDVLSPYCKTLSVPARPSLLEAGGVWHLSSPVSGTLRSTDYSSIELAAALHPTPAVCGCPTEGARSAIERLEPFDRGLYAGMVGWCAPSGDGEWAIALRCAETHGAGARLFAGVGVVEGSTPEDEYAETAAKLRTMLKALGVEEDDVKEDGGADRASFEPEAASCL